MSPTCSAAGRRPIAVAIFLLVLVLAMAGGTARAAVWLGSEQVGAELVGNQVQYLVDDTGSLSLDQVMSRARQGALKASYHDALSFGIGSKPVWMRLQLENPSVLPAAWHLFAGAPWVDRMDMHLVQDGQVLQQLAGGDRVAGGADLVPGLATDFALQVPPGQSEIWMRVETTDPMVVPLVLADASHASLMRLGNGYSYGLIYGFVLALLGYNLILFMGLRQRSHLNYSIYLAAFLFMSFAYTAHGLVWLWPEALGFQRFVPFIGMLVYSICGFRFALEFLDLRQYAPRMATVVRYSCMAAAALMALAVLLGGQREAAFISFTFAIWFTLAMVEMGWTAVVRQSPAGRYFLLAACVGMAGTLITTLTVWGWVPYSRLAYRAVEFGILLEATLLGLAVAFLVRQHEAARTQAEKLADVEPLTGLLNRRAFLRQAVILIETARRQHQPLALVLLDLDHFKRINDQFGHAAGDNVLASMARLIRSGCRSADLAGRWGGEEFILLLPDAGLDHALMLAERLQTQFALRDSGVDASVTRQDVLADDRVGAARLSDGLALTASFGLAALEPGDDLDSLVQRADAALYQAKHDGRNCIRVAEVAQPDSQPEADADPGVASS